jgi:gluconolactonase
VILADRYGIRGDFLLHDERFRGLVPPNGFVEKLFTGTRWAEGPVYFPHHAVGARRFRRG